MPPRQTCFFIAPIGDPGSATRARSDNVLKHILQPALRRCGYAAVRADRLSEPGNITTDVIEHLVSDALVIADLTDYNPNVFYEIAIRHAAGRPIIQIIDSRQRIPFHLSTFRTIRFDVSDLESALQCTDELVRTIRAVERQIEPPDSPLRTWLESVRLKSASTVGVGADEHYIEASKLVRKATSSIVLSQRTSTLLLGPERGRVPEVEFRDELLAALRRGLVVYHLVHEPSCIADILSMTWKFSKTLGDLPQAENLIVGRYQGEKPVPRVLVVDGRILSSVFDVDQMQFFAVVQDAEKVSMVDQHLKRFINEEGTRGFSPERFLDRLREARRNAELLQPHRELDSSDVFPNYVASQLRERGLNVGIVNFLIANENGSDAVVAPLAWPRIRKAVFFDKPTLDNDVAERTRTWAMINAATKAGWSNLFIARSEMLLRLDAVVEEIATFAAQPEVGKERLTA